MIDWTLVFKEIDRIECMPDWTGGEFSKGYAQAIADVRESLQAMSEGKSVWKEPTK
jgi:hypothetical protein